jgi:hypothetical protein
MYFTKKNNKKGRVQLAKGPWNGQVAKRHGISVASWWKYAKCLLTSLCKVFVDFIRILTYCQCLRCCSLGFCLYWLGEKKVIDFLLFPPPPFILPLQLLHVYILPYLSLSPFLSSCFYVFLCIFLCTLVRQVNCKISEGVTASLFSVKFPS